MKANMGSADRMIRIAIAAMVIIAYFTNLISGTTAIVLGIIAGVFLLTSFLSFCPLYTAFGWSTKKQ